jgi:hypothetical protein
VSAVLKRTFWFATGAGAGFGGAMWVRRQVLRTVQRYTPEQVQADVSDSVRRLGTDVVDAVRSGRAAMADREAELRAELRPGAGPELVPLATAEAVPVPASEPAPGSAPASPPSPAIAGRRTRRLRRSGTGDRVARH